MATTATATSPPFRSWILLLLLLVVVSSLVSPGSAFTVTSLPASHSRGPRGVKQQQQQRYPGSSSSTQLCAVAKKKTVVKKKVVKKVAKKKADGAAAAAETLKKQDIVNAIVEKTELSKADADAALTAALETIVEEVAAGKKINLFRFGTFKSSERAARQGRNPKTGEAMDIPAKTVPSFSAAKAFKEKMNE